MYPRSGYILSISCPDAGSILLDTSTYPRWVQTKRNSHPYQLKILLKNLLEGRSQLSGWRTSAVTLPTVAAYTGSNKCAVCSEVWRSHPYLVATGTIALHVSRKSLVYPLILVSAYRGARSLIYVCNRPRSDPQIDFPMTIGKWNETRDRSRARRRP